MIYRFDEFELDTDRFELRRAGEICPVEPQVFALLELLIENHHRAVTKDEINLRVWGGRVVSEAALSSRIKSARRAIGDNGAEQRFIQTVRNRGFRFAATPARESQIGAAPANPLLVAPTGEGARVGTSQTPERPSIAVLPFLMLNEDPRFAMLADALSHDVIIELSRLHWLFVIARGSSFRFRGPEVDIGTTASLLGARYVLTGTLSVHGRRSIVTAELIYAPEQRIVWAERFENPLDDLLQLRLALAASIVNAIEVRIPLAEANRSASVPTGNLDAWSAYHRGLWHMYRFNRHDNEIAAHMFERAVTADPNFARAHAGLSFTHFQNAFVGYTQDAAAQRLAARERAEKSLDLDPFDPFANLTMGRAAMITGDVEGAIPWFDRALELNPNYALGYYNRAFAQVIVGQGSKAEDNVDKAVALSPLDPLLYAMLASRALSLVARGDYQEASDWADKSARAPNAHVLISATAALAHELAGNRPSAERWVASVHNYDPNFRADLYFRAFPFRDEAMLNQARAALKRLGL